MIMRNNQDDELYTRLAAVRQKLAEWQVEGLLISNPSNRRWLSGFTGSAGQLMITPEKALLATDFRYWEQATSQAPAYTLFKHQRREEDITAFMAAAGVARIGLEAQHVTLSELATLKKATASLERSVTWVPLEETVEHWRQVKSEAEIELIRTAAAITDHTMAQINHLARPGQTEQQLAWELEKIMRQAGAEATAFTLIVASGPNSGLPHHQPGERILQVGDVIVVDMGAQLHGYKSDLTRTFYLGNEPDEQFWNIYHLVLEAQMAAIQKIQPGMTAKEADAVGRQVIANAGHGEHFGHGLGHGLGLDIHEKPALSTRPPAEKEILTAGMVTTIEPGVYLPGWGGVRIEDLAYVRETGVALLSNCPKVPAIPLIA
jgi:Xaa-Pro aminopeptidase